MRGVYSIKELEKLSGIKAHTIRIWERRYSIMNPRRTQTNIRCYSSADLKRLLNISILYQNGFKISKIANLNDEQLRGRILDVCLDGRNHSVQIKSMMVAMFDMDARKFLDFLSGAIIKLGFEDCVEHILFPFLERIGVLWQTGSVCPAQEHFVSNLVRQKLIVAIDNEMQFTETGNVRMIFFLPEQELHEMGLLFYNLVARKMGAEVTYLGASVSVDDLKQVQQQIKAHAFFTSVILARGKDELEDLLRVYKREFPDIPFFVTGLQIREHQPLLPKGFKAIGSAKAFKEAVGSLKFKG